MDNCKALIFDLDGTLYVNDGLGNAINLSACRYVAERNGVDLAAGTSLLNAARKQLADNGQAATLSHAVLALGGDLRELHARFSADIHPENYLTRDERVVKLLSKLGERLDLHIYTNNNRRLATAILARLGLTPLFRRVFTIEDSWQPKPDREVLERIFKIIDRQAGECLFIGDRYDVDLRLPAEMGSAVFIVNTIEDLLSLARIFIKENL